MQITKISDRGVKLIKSFEGFKSKPYLCSAGVPTIGYGSTYYTDGRKVTLNDPPISEAEGETLLNSTLRAYEECISKNVSSDINQNQFDALVSFAYNVGCANLRNSTLLKLINGNGSNEDIKKEFLKWNKAGGKILTGLTLRRQAEAELYG